MAVIQPRSTAVSDDAVAEAGAGGGQLAHVDQHLPLFRDGAHDLFAQDLFGLPAHELALDPQHDPVLLGLTVDAKSHHTK